MRISENCISRKCVLSRCWLCRFRISESEPVVAITESGLTTSEFMYSDSAIHTDGLQELRLSPCQYHPCIHRSGVVVGCHAACLAVASPPSASFLRATQHSFEPREIEQGRRHAHIQRMLALKLSLRYQRLPIELWLIVADHLVRESATITTLQTCAAGYLRSDVNIQTTSSIWARYVCLDDTAYISALSNEPEDEKSVRILDIAAIPHIDTLYVSEDHLGIRQIIFARSGDPTDLSGLDYRKPGVWWQTVSVPSGVLRAKSDGFKLRRITSTATSECHQTDILWPSPMSTPRTKLLHFHSLVPTYASLPSRHALRMTSLKCNDPAITGYSGCWSGSIFYLHAHMEGEDLSFYQDLDLRLRHPLWVYMPVDFDETISAIWQRPGKQNRHTAIMFQTNKDRVATIGPHHAPRSPGLLWTQIHTASGEPTEIYFNDSPLGVYQLASESPPHYQPARASNMLPLHPTSRGVEGFFYSSASLRDVEEIVTCERRCETCSLVCGLLIRYSNGSRACVGEFRLDSTGTTFRVNNSSTLYLGFSRSKDNYPYVARVEISPPEDRGSHEWLELPWEGELEWWFSEQQCKVYHSSKESPETR